MMPSRMSVSMNAEAAKGFTLVEILITVSIVGILAAIAIPSYQNVTQKARRHDAEDALMGLRQAMERHYARNGTYAGAANAAGVPQIFAAQTPLEGAGHYYDLRIITSTSSTHELDYELVATPVVPQTNDPCGTLKLNQAGKRGSGRSDGQCWNGTMSYP
jgi:type IV pilus assembly protein PilE